MGTHGRGIYKMNVRPIQKAFQEGTPQAAILFETPKANLPWMNDTRGGPDFRTLEKVPITFYLMEATEVEIQVIDEGEKSSGPRVLQVIRVLISTDGTSL